MNDKLQAVIKEFTAHDVSRQARVVLADDTLAQAVMDEVLERLDPLLEGGYIGLDEIGDDDTEAMLEIEAEVDDDQVWDLFRRNWDKTEYTPHEFFTPQDYAQAVTDWVVRQLVFATLDLINAEV